MSTAQIETRGPHCPTSQVRSERGGRDSRCRALSPLRESEQREEAIEDLTRKRDEACARLVTLMRSKGHVKTSFSLSDLEWRLDKVAKDLPSHTCTFATLASPPHMPVTRTNCTKNNEGPPRSTRQDKITESDSLYSKYNTRRSDEQSRRVKNTTKSPSSKTSMIQAAGDFCKALTSLALSSRTMNKAPPKSSRFSPSSSSSEQTFVEGMDTDRPGHRDRCHTGLFHSSTEGHGSVHGKYFHSAKHFSQSFTSGEKKTGASRKLKEISLSDSSLCRSEKDTQDFQQLMELFHQAKESGAVVEVGPVKEISSSDSCLYRSDKDLKDSQQLMELFQLAKESGAVVEVGPESPVRRRETPRTTVPKLNTRPDVLQLQVKSESILGAISPYRACTATSF